MYDFLYWFIIFISYSILGWVIEIIACSIEERKMVKDRGFLLGPYCPIWGWGAVLIIGVLGSYKDDPKALFLFALVGSAVLEYLTSYIMEKIFKARWWDYSHKKFNVEGRICLSNCVGFGILGLIIVNFINPLYSGIIEWLPDLFFIIIASVIFVLFMIDNIISLTIMTKLRSNLVSIKKDATYDIDFQVKEILAKNKFVTKHIFRAFPTVNFKLPSANDIVAGVRKKLDEIEIAIKKEKEKRRRK